MKHDTSVGTWRRLCGVTESGGAVLMISVTLAYMLFVCRKAVVGFCFKLHVLTTNLDGLKLVDVVNLLLWWFG